MPTAELTKLTNQRAVCQLSAMTKLTNQIAVQMTGTAQVRCTHIAVRERGLTSVMSGETRYISAYTVNEVRKLFVHVEMAILFNRSITAFQPLSAHSPR